jgi:hypothetical protein
MTTYEPSNPIAGASLGSAERWIPWFRDQGAERMEDVELYLRTIYQVAPTVGLGAHKIVCQMILETGAGRSAAWKGSLNPAGIGVTSDAMRNWHDFGNGQNAALAHLVHVALYVFGTLPPQLLEHKARDPRAAAVGTSILGRRATLASFGGSTPANPTWAVDPDYGDKWAAILNTLQSRFAGDPIVSPAPPAGGTPVGYSATIPGVPGGPVTTEAPIRLMIVPAHLTNCRPGILARLPRENVQHENGNPNASALADSTYLFNGAEGRTASWHMTVDDTIIVINIPLNEVTWQAGDGAGPGNYNGISCELSQLSAMMADPVRKRRARRNAAEIMGRVAARLNAPPPAAQHATYMAKNCPQYLRTEPGAWTQYQADFAYFYNDERIRMGGTVPAPAGSIAIGDIVRYVNPEGGKLNVRGGPGVSFPIMHQLDPGDAAKVIGGPKYADGYTWWDLAVSGGTGFAVSNWLEEVIPPAPAPTPPAPPAPVYAKPLLINALLATDLQYHDTAPAIITADPGTANEVDFVFVADVVEPLEDLKSLQWADYKRAPAVAAPKVKGPAGRFIGAWLFEASDGCDYYLTPAPEWARVLHRDASGKLYTKRISDAPLLGNDASTSH